MNNCCKIFSNISFPKTWLIKTRLKDYDTPLVFDLELDSIVYALLQDNDEMIDKSKLMFYYTAIAYTARGWFDEEFVTQGYAFDVFLEEVNEMLKTAGLPLIGDDFNVDICVLYIRINNLLEDLIGNYLKIRDYTFIDYTYVTTSDMLYWIKNDGDNFVTNINISFNYCLSIPNIRGVFCLLRNKKEVL